MTYKTSDGSYALEDGKMVAIDYIEQVLQNATLMLGAKRGGFYPDKNFGSSINPKESLASVLAYARQSVCDLDGVCIKNARLEENKIVFDILINDEGRVIEINA